ncbi:hypothetical protein EON80_16730 [bacterium]|nr:MAG: hypothetical protein EON80_16730 [bacterium]
MNIKHSHNNPLSAIKMLTGFVVLGGALYGLTLSPAYSQPTPPAPPAGAPAGEPRDDLRPVEGEVKVGPDGRLLGGPKDGPKGGPKDEPKHGPKDGPKHGPKGGPKDGPGGPGPGGPGPGGPGPGGPGPGGPHEKRGPEATLENVYRGAGELDRYGMLEGDVLNLTGQAHDYYNRAGVALEAGDQLEAGKLAKISERLTQAALHLIRAEKGPLPQLKVVGWEAPPQSKLPTPPAETEGQEPRILDDLSRRLQDVPAAPVNTSWVETARRIAAEAQQDMDAKRSQAGHERSMAAMQLLEAADSRTRPHPI